MNNDKGVLNFYETVTDPFDWFAVLCPIEEAQRILSDQRCDDWIIRCSMRFASGELGKLRKGEGPRVLFIPAETTFHTIVVFKEDNNGTCYWYSDSVAALHMVHLMMNQNSDIVKRAWSYNEREELKL